MPKYGLIVEGTYDTPVFQTLIRRLNEPEAEFFIIEANGYGNLKKYLHIYLTRLNTAFQGAPPDKTFVIADSGRKQPNNVVAELKASVGRHTYTFPYALCVVVTEMETWLLSDERAITSVARRHHGRDVGYKAGDLETLVEAKETFTAVLSGAGLLYTPAICGEIAAAIDLRTLRYRCASFREFSKSFHE